MAWITNHTKLGVFFQPAQRAIIIMTNVICLPKPRGMGIKQIKLGGFVLPQI